MSKVYHIPIYNLPIDIKEEIVALKNNKQTSVNGENLTSLQQTQNGVITIQKENSLLHFACSLCSKVFSTLNEQKEHYKSQEHLDKLKRKMEDVNSDEESESGDEDDTMDIVEDGCLLSLNLKESRITIIKRLVEKGFNNRDTDMSQLADHLDGHYCIILYRSGFFILGIYDHGKLLLSRQEKRYTTRRKQGGAQRKKDNGTGKAISMGARLRRHNEQLMQDFVRTTLRTLHDEINQCSVIFIGTTKLNLSLFFEEGCLEKTNPSIRKLPLFFGKPNLTEMNRMYNQLVTVNISDIEHDIILPTELEPIVKHDETTITASQPTETKEDNTAAMNIAVYEDDDEYDHFWKAIQNADLTQLTNILTSRPHYIYLWNDEGETPLHIASLNNQSDVIALLLACGSDPTLRDLHERLPYPLCTTKNARNTYRRYRYDHPEEYDWVKSAVPEPLSEEQVLAQKNKQKAKKRKQKEKKQEKKDEIHEVETPQPVTKEDIKAINNKFTSTPTQKMSMAEQMKLTSRLHKLASRLQVTYHDLIGYLSQDSTSIAEQAQNLETLLDSGEIPAEVILENMFGF